MNQAARGDKALEAKDFQTAVQEYTAALKISPTAPAYYIQRSQAYQRWGKYEEALKDADKAVVYAQKRGKKELIVDAQYKRAVALVNLGRQADAIFLLDIVKRLSPNHKLADMARARAVAGLGKLGDSDEATKVNVKETPTVEPTESEEAAGPSKTGASTAAATAKRAAAPAETQQTPVDKIRQEWYQNSDSVFFTLLAKGVPKDKCTIEIQPRSLSISFPIGDTGSSYDLTLDPLFADVVPEKCTPRVLGTKVEVVLVKATAGQKWHGLESSEPVASEPSASPATHAADIAVKRAVFKQSAATSGPAYPSSARTGPKNWDAIELEDADDKGGDEANDFFKMLYKDASPETRRAMIKSYTESNGTALSTNWDEVSKGKVETLPPDGMEERKYAI